MGVKHLLKLEIQKSALLFKVNLSKSNKYHPFFPLNHKMVSEISGRNIFLQDKDTWKKVLLNVSLEFVSK